MTTEVLRNMIYARSPTLDGLRYVVLDEVHYLQDRYRGAVWEEVIIHLPAEIDIVCLSATVSNAEEVAAWMQTVRGDDRGDHRGAPAGRARAPVHWSATAAADALHLLPTFVDGRRRAAPEPRGARASTGAARAARGHGPPARRLYKPWRTEVVERLADERMLPGDRVRVQPRRLRPGRRAVPRRRACGSPTPTSARAICSASPSAHVEPASTTTTSTCSATTRGSAGWRRASPRTTPGMVPPMKEAVEEAFTAGLLKVVFATETLSLGINMPARSVVIEKLSKFTGEHHEFLTPGEYTQLAGRAGRRGIDDVGYVGRAVGPVRALRPGRRARVAAAPTR